MKTGTLALFGIGGLFLWSGFHGASVTGSLRDLVSGQQPPATNANPLGGMGSSTAATSLTAPAGDTSAHSASAASNQALARLLAVSMGHAAWTTGQQWADWVSLWNQESGWRTDAQNPTSTAYGIAQFLDTTWAPYGPKTSNATLQITYGIRYISDRYGSPSAAWLHEKQMNWY